MTRRPLALLGVSLASAALVVASAVPASAHAIVDLTGKPAYAGKTSVMTLEVQHGCLQNETGIDKVVAYFGREFGKVKPSAVPGWKATSKRTSDGRKVVWTLTGSVPAFNTPTYFPMTITWPAKPGVYGMPVKQWCGSATNIWDVPDGPATADKPSPPLYPLPQVKVLPRR
ncbi:MAG: DUF1775 domain-containing protein [Candidatus Nanopelagicales bacterium]|jgi:hypothetical protein